MAALKKILCIITDRFWRVMFIAGKIADKAYIRFWHPFFQKLDVTFKDSTIMMYCI